MSRLSPDADDGRFIRRVLILIAIGAFVVAIVRASDMLILAFGSMLGAIAIHAMAEFYENHLKLPAKAALAAAMVTALAFVGFLIWLITVQFGPQINILVAQLPGLIDQFAAYLSQSPIGAKIVSAVQAAYAGSQAAHDISGLVRGLGELSLNILLLIVGALFFAISPGVYERGFLLLIPKQHRPAVSDALSDAASTLKLWLRAQIILMTTMGVLVGIGLWISGVPSAAALGLLAGLSEFIPYIGPTVAMLPALGLAATASNSAIVGTLLTYIFVRLLQTNFITPYVQNRVISIPPAITLFAIIAIGMVFGLFGLFFSAAILVVIFSLIRSLYLRDVLGEEVDTPGDVEPSFTNPEP